MFRRLQTFIDWTAESPGKYCVEVSYFPDEICSDLFTVLAFDSQIEAWRSFLDAKDYFVRFENASGKFMMREDWV